MNNIIEPNDNFDFSKLSLGHPTGIQGGSYFTKLLYNNNPLYIQTYKSLTRQGFVKTGKKYYCDLMFDNNAESMIRWLENLEETCQNLIFNKSESWFQNSLDKNDVETAFNSILRIYKSGKYYLLRTFLKNSLNGDANIKIYNENEIPLTINDIHDDTLIISILEIQGIKFTSRNFQIEIELKQIMVLDKEPIFDNCLIKTNKKNISIETKSFEDKIDNLETKLESLGNLDINENNENENENNSEILNENTEHNFNKNDDLTFNNETFSDDKEELNNNNNNNNNIQIDIEDLNNEFDNEIDKEDLKEVDLNINLENTLESFTLKKPNQVYYELYKEAREKAKQAKKNAIIAYLEAKNIKKTYMLENIDNDDMDSDIDEEIDEVSESELQEL